MSGIWARIRDCSGYEAGPFPLVTQRLILRPVKRADACDFYRYAREPRVARYVFWEPHRSLHETKQLIHVMRKDIFGGAVGNLGIIRKADGRLIGTIGLMAVDWDNRGAEIGFSLALDCWGQGYMPEAIRAFLEYGFETLELERIEARHDTRNPASGRAMQKAGMAFEGILRQKIYYKGEYADLALYASLKKEWKKLKGVPHEN